MIDINLSEEAMNEFNRKLLELEKKNLNNLSPADDLQMVNSILRLYEEVKNNYENK